MNYLRCEQPHELRGKIFTKMEPQQFCDAPLILKLAIQDIQPYSVLVSWQSREHSGLHGYQIVYHSLDGVDEVRDIYTIYSIYFFLCFCKMCKVFLFFRRFFFVKYTIIKQVEKKMN